MPQAPTQAALVAGEEVLGRIVGALDNRHGAAALVMCDWMPEELVAIAVQLREGGAHTDLQRCAPALRAIIWHGYPLRLDATCEQSRGGLFLSLDGWRGWVLPAARI